MLRSMPRVCAPSLSSTPVPRARAPHLCLNSTPILSSDWVFVPTCRTWRHICAGSVSCQVPLPPLGSSKTARPESFPQTRPRGAVAGEENEESACAWKPGLVSAGVSAGGHPEDTDGRPPPPRPCRPSPTRRRRRPSASPATSCDAAGGRCGERADTGSTPSCSRPGLSPRSRGPPVCPCTRSSSTWSQTEHHSDRRDIRWPPGRGTRDGSRPQADGHRAGARGSRHPERGPSPSQGPRGAGRKEPSAVGEVGGRPSSPPPEPAGSRGQGRQRGGQGGRFGRREIKYHGPGAPRGTAPARPLPVTTSPRVPVPAEGATHPGGNDHKEKTQEHKSLGAPPPTCEGSTPNKTFGMETGSSGGTRLGGTSSTLWDEEPEDGDARAVGGGTCPGAAPRLTGCSRGSHR